MHSYCSLSIMNFYNISFTMHFSSQSSIKHFHSKSSTMHFSCQISTIHFHCESTAMHFYNESFLMYFYSKLSLAYFYDDILMFVYAIFSWSNNDWWKLIFLVLSFCLKYLFLNIYIYVYNLFIRNFKNIKETSNFKENIHFAWISLYFIIHVLYN